MENKLLLFVFYCYMIFNIILYVIGSANVLKNDILFWGNLCLFLCCIADFNNISKKFEEIELPSWLLYISFILVAILSLYLSEK